MLFFAAALALTPQLPTPRAAPRSAPPTMLGGAPPQQHLQRTALAALAAAVLVAAPMDAEAARSGGRMGGRAPAMRSAPMRSAPMRGGGGYGGGYGGGRTNVIISPGIGMGMSPFGYGYGYGYGISPGAYLGLTLAETLLREQQRQAYLEQQLRTQQQLGQDQAMIQQLQTALAEQSAKVEGLRAQGGGGGGGAAAPAQTADQAQIERLTRELAEQKAALQKLQTAQ